MRAAVASTVVTLRNTGSPQTAGSAEVYFPAGSVESSLGGEVGSCARARRAPPRTGRRTSSARDSLNMAPGQIEDASPSRSRQRRTSRRRSPPRSKTMNQFNDSSGTANLFTAQGGFPTLRVVQCVQSRAACSRIATSTSRTSSRGTRPSMTKTSPRWAGRFSSSRRRSEPGRIRPRPSRRQRRWPKASTRSPAFRRSPTTRSAWSLPPPTTDSKWGLQKPDRERRVRNDLERDQRTSRRRPGNCFRTSLDPPRRWPRTSKWSPSSGRSVRVTASTIGGFKVTAASNPDQKPDQLYVQDTWVDDEGRTVYRFSPILPCAPPQDCSKKIFLLEVSRLLTSTWMTARVNRPSWSTTTNAWPFPRLPELKPMPYCNIDPTASRQGTATTGVLPGTDTSCIVTGTQNVVAGGDVHVVYQVDTAYSMRSAGSAEDTEEAVRRGGQPR